MSGTPEKRHTVRVLAAAGSSTRRACELVGTSRSHLAYEAKPRDDGELLAAIAEIRRRKPRWGVRRTHRQLRIIFMRAGCAENGHQTVAGEFIHHAIIPVDALDEAAQEIVDQIEDRFGVQRS